MRTNTVFRLDKFFFIYCIDIRLFFTNLYLGLCFMFCIRQVNQTYLLTYTQNLMVHILIKKRRTYFHMLPWKWGERYQMDILTQNVKYKLLMPRQKTKNNGKTHNSRHKAHRKLKTEQHGTPRKTSGDLKCTRRPILPIFRSTQFNSCLSVMLTVSIFFMTSHISVNLQKGEPLFQSISIFFRFHDNDGYLEKIKHKFFTWKFTFLKVFIKFSYRIHRLP